MVVSHRLTIFWMCQIIHRLLVFCRISRFKLRNIDFWFEKKWYNRACNCKFWMDTFSDFCNLTALSLTGRFYKIKSCSSLSLSEAGIDSNFNVLKHQSFCFRYLPENVQKLQEISPTAPVKQIFIENDFLKNNSFLNIYFE